MFEEKTDKMENQIKSGDLVMLKSGSVTMTVSSINVSNQSATCIYWDANKFECVHVQTCVAALKTAS